MNHGRYRQTEHRLWASLDLAPTERFPSRIGAYGSRRISCPPIRRQMMCRSPGTTGVP